MKISIITATYNSAATIADTINSVLSQDYSDIEYLVIDGGSSDATIEIVKANAPKFDGRLRWISENDHGIYDAMNKGIRMATGDIVGILNSDDYYTSNDVLSTYANAFKTSKVDGQPHKVARYYSSKIFRPTLLRFGFMPAHPSFYVRRSVYEQAGFYSLDYKIGADFEMMVRLFRKYRISYKYIQKDMVTMRMGGASTSGVGSHRLLLKEDARACRENRIYSNTFLISLKYFYKIFEFKI